LRQAIKFRNTIETGSPGSGVFTRNFTFKADECPEPKPTSDPCTQQPNIGTWNVLGWYNRMSGSLRILCLGHDHPHSTSRHRAEALRRIGCEVKTLNPQQAYKQLKIHPKLNQITGYWLVAPLVDRWLDQQIKDKQFDLAWVSQCPEISPKAVVRLRNKCGKVLNYVNDDPTGNRDGNRWHTFRKAIGEYDFCFVRNAHCEPEFKLYHAKQVFRGWMTYDEVAHAPFADKKEIPATFHSEVAFVGTWMKDEGRNGRDYFLFKLIEAGIPVSIWGERWYKSPFWSRLKPHWLGSALGGRDYVAAIQGAKISLGFLSKRNRDLHTRRSVEIPYAGGLLCAERTSEHLQLYQEGVEAVFWSSPEECIEVCRELLADEPRRRQIREAGMKRVRRLGLGNETICRKILSELGYTAYANAQTEELFRMQAIRD
jgi:Glycosyl transferases group 1